MASFGTPITYKERLDRLRVLGKEIPQLKLYVNDICRCYIQPFRVGMPCTGRVGRRWCGWRLEEEHTEMATKLGTHGVQTTVNKDLEWYNDGISQEG